VTRSLVSGRAARSAVPNGDSGPDEDTGYLTIARVTGPHGIHGEVRCAILTDFPDRFRTTRQVFLGDRKTPRSVERWRLVRGAVILKLSDVETRADAERLQGSHLFVPLDDAVRLDADSYFWYQIIGLDVRTVDGEALGKVVDILETGSNDVYVVRSADGQVLIPAIHEVVRSIDVDAGVMTVRLLDGLR